MGQRQNLEGGLTLIEVVVAVFIMTPILVMVVGVFFKNVKGVTESWEETRGVAAGQRLMENVRRMRWDETTPFGGTAVTSGATIGINSGEIGPLDFDDIDDWNGHTSPDPISNSFNRSVRVEFVQVNLGTGEITAVAGPTNFKRVTVIVTGPGGKPIEISTLRTNSRN
jgi:type II secretory pathway pseudopilin PulG